MILDIGSSHRETAERWARRVLAIRFGLWIAREGNEDILHDLIDAIERGCSLETLTQKVQMTSTNPTFTMIWEVETLDSTGEGIAEIAGRTGHSHAGVHVAEGKASIFLCEEEDALQIAETRGLEMTYFEGG